VLSGVQNAPFSALFMVVAKEVVIESDLGEGTLSAQFKCSSPGKDGYVRQFIVTHSRIEAVEINLFQVLFSGEEFQ
jgi:hypothetical protein